MRDVWIEGKKRLEAVGIENFGQEAETLLAWCLGLKRSDLWNQMKEIFPSSCQTKFEKVLARREAREPLQLILGSWDFMGLRFRMRKGVFIPRPETEAIATKALEILEKEQKKDKDREKDKEKKAEARNPNQYRILDLGVGSGVLLGSLLVLGPKKASGVGIDRSSKACALAAENMRGLGVDSKAYVIQGSWFDAIGAVGMFDLIVSNPPYLDPELEATIQPEVSWDPPQSLYAQERGLADIRQILDLAVRHLVPGGWLVLETGSLLVPATQALAENLWACTAPVADESGSAHGWALQRT